MDGLGGMTPTRARTARRLRHYLSRLFQFNLYQPTSFHFWRRQPASQHRRLLSSCSASADYSLVCLFFGCSTPLWVTLAWPRPARYLCFALAVLPEVTVCLDCCSNPICPFPACHSSGGTSQPRPSPCSSSLTYLSGRR